MSKQDWRLLQEYKATGLTPDQIELLQAELSLEQTRCKTIQVTGETKRILMETRIAELERELEALRNA